MTLAFALVIVTAFVLVERKRRETIVANRNLAASRDKGRQVIDDFCRQLSEDGWGDDPALQERRKRLLEMGLAYYRDFLEDPNAETPVSSELIRTYFRIGVITDALDKREEARNAFNRVLAACYPEARRRTELESVPKAPPLPCFGGEGLGVREPDSRSPPSPQPLSPAVPGERGLRDKL